MAMKKVKGEVFKRLPAVLLAVMVSIVFTPPMAALAAESPQPPAAPQVLAYGPAPEESAAPPAPILPEAGAAQQVAPLAPPAEPAWTTVTVVSDAASLQKAINDAGTKATLIPLAGDITLSGTQISIPYNAVIKITGANPSGDNYKIDANKLSRVIYEDYYSKLYLQDITITGGYADYSAGILSHSELYILQGARISGNVATKNGGGVGVSAYNYAVSYIIGAEISGNSAGSSEIPDNGATYGFGGGISCGSPVTITDSIVSNNTATYGGGGISMDMHVVFTMTDSEISYNTAGSYGGGIYGDYYLNKGAVSIGSSRLIGNSAADGGAICIGQYSYMDTTPILNIGSDVVFNDNSAAQTNCPPIGNSLDAYSKATQCTWPFAAVWNNRDVGYFPVGVTPFVGVEGVTGVPLFAQVGALSLNASVIPDHLQPQDIKWSVKSAGTTGATVSGNTLTTSAPGVVTLTATIKDGVAAGTDYTQDFRIAVAGASAAQSVLYGGGGISAQTPDGYSDLRTSYMPPLVDDNCYDEMAFGPDGSLYVADNYYGLYKVPANGGPATLLEGNALKNIVAVCYQGGDLYAINHDSSDGSYILYRVGPDTGACNMLYKFPNASWIESDASGNLWVLNNNSDNSSRVLYQMAPDKMAIARTIPLPGFAAGNTIAGFTFDVNGNLYVSNYQDKKIYKVNPADGTYTDSGIALSASPSGLRFDAGGNLYIAARSSGSYQILKVPAGSNTPAVLCETTERGKVVQRANALPMDAAGNLYAADRDIGNVMKFLADPGQLLTIDKMPSVSDPAQGTAGPNAYVKVTAGEKTAVVQADASGHWDATAAVGPFAAGELVAAQVVSDASGATAVSEKVEAYAVKQVYVPVTGITGAPASITATIPYNLMCKVTPDNATKRMINWSVKDNGGANVVASIVGSTLNTYYNSAGVITVTATVKGGLGEGVDFVKDIQINVEKRFYPVTSISGVPTTGEAGKALTLPTMAGTVDTTNRTIIWTVKDDGGTGSTVSGGKLLATAPGTVILNARVINGKSPTEDFVQDYTIQIAPAYKAVTDIINLPTTATAGVPLILTGTVVPADAVNTVIEWVISNVQLTGATLDGDILYTQTPGTVTMIARVARGVSETTSFVKNFTIKVNASPDPPFVPVTGITGAPATATAGTPLALTAVVAPANATKKAIAWSVKSAGTTGATVSGSTLNTAAAGTAIVTATVKDALAATRNFSQDFTITVNAGTGGSGGTNGSGGSGGAGGAGGTGGQPGSQTGANQSAPVPVTAIRSAQTTFYVVKGKSLTIPYAYDLAAGATTQPVFIWTSSDPASVSVTPAGAVKGLVAGKSATVTVTSDNGQSKAFTVKVVKAAVKATKVSVSKPPKTMTVGATAILKVKVAPAKATGAVVAFSSSKASVVSVDKAGKLTALAKGTAKITVKAGGQKTIFTVTVK